MYTWEQARLLIAKYESGFKNKLNYRYDPTHTASGYWQITDTNWRNIAPNLGIDVSQFPRAIDAPQSLQERVAKFLFDRNYFNDWAPFNPSLASAIRRGETVAGSPTFSSGVNQTVPQPKPLAPLPQVKVDSGLQKFFLLGTGTVLITLALFSMRG